MESQLEEYVEEQCDMVTSSSQDLAARQKQVTHNVKTLQLRRYDTGADKQRTVFIIVCCKEQRFCSKYNVEKEIGKIYTRYIEISSGVSPLF